MERGDYYAILPMLPELRDPNRHEVNALKKEFSSADVVLDMESTVALLKTHKLMVEDVDLAASAEFLR